jgi:hypothetical protein
VGRGGRAFGPVSLTALLSSRSTIGHLHDDKPDIRSGIFLTRSAFAAAKPPPCQDIHAAREASSPASRATAVQDTGMFHFSPAASIGPSANHAEDPVNPTVRSKKRHNYRQCLRC